MIYSYWLAVITKSKIFLQQLCKEKLSWDESLPESHNTEWNAICKNFGQIKQASYPRLVLFFQISRMRFMDFVMPA